MACFRPRDTSNPRRADWVMLRNGPVTLFHSRDVLDRTRALLARGRYREIELDARPWRSSADLHDAVTKSFGFPGGLVGRNGRDADDLGGMDGFDDWMYDFVEGAYAADPQAEATAIVVIGFDAFARVAPDAAHAFLDILACHVPRAMMHGHRLLVLVQSDDPRLELAAVGGSRPRWNEDEWLDKKRGL